MINIEIEVYDSGVIFEFPIKKSKIDVFRENEILEYLKKIKRLNRVDRNEILLGKMANISIKTTDLFYKIKISIPKDKRFDLIENFGFLNFDRKAIQSFYDDIISICSLSELDKLRSELDKLRSEFEEFKIKYIKGKTEFHNQIIELRELLKTIKKDLDGILKSGGNETGDEDNNDDNSHFYPMAMRR